MNAMHLGIYYILYYCYAQHCDGSLVNVPNTYRQAPVYLQSFIFNF